MINLNDYKNLNLILANVGGMIKDEYKERLAKKDSKGRNTIATGKLYNSVEYKIKTDDNFIYLYLSLADHWVRVEYDSNWGTKPPPIANIRIWMRSKKLNYYEKGLEYAIQRSIQRNGIKGKHHLQNAIKEVKTTGWIAKLNEALKKDIEYQLNKTIKQINIKTR